MSFDFYSNINNDINNKLRFSELLLYLEDWSLVPAGWSKSLVKFVGQYVVDLVWFFPKKVIDWNYYHVDYQSKIDQEIAIKVQIINHIYRAYSNKCFIAEGITDTNEVIHIVYFNSYFKLVQKLLPLHSTKVVFGKLEWKQKRFCMFHPQKVVNIDALSSDSLLVVNYKNLPKIKAVELTQFMHQFIRLLPQLSEWYDQEFVDNNSFPSWYESIARLHYIKEYLHIDLFQAQKRLMLDELVAYQTTLSSLRHRNYKITTTRLKPLVLTGFWVEKLIQNLPFKLTPEQEEVISSIRADLQSTTHPMTRLLQGDVGTGKTIVALIAMLYILEAQQQAILVAPSTILAYQHYQNFQQILLPLGLSCVCLTSKTKLSESKKILADIAAGNVQIILGTHAILNTKIIYPNLGLVIIDEQHKFGVKQRNALLFKQTQMPHLLMLSATPIPRTLALAQFGDIKVSNLKSKLPGHKNIKTALLSLKQIDQLIVKLQGKIISAEKIYWICPAISQSRDSNAQARFEHLVGIFGHDKVMLIHGKMSKMEQDLALQQFIVGKCQILVSTIILELGIDIPSVNIIVIERAEQFGLAQLHQLRGRVGRSNQQGYCVLLCQDDISSESYARLRIVSEHNDGFVIAEKDLLLRGSGNIMLTHQSGFPDFKILKVEYIAELLPLALKHSGDFVHNPNKELVQVFGYDQTLNYLYY